MMSNKLHFATACFFILLFLLSLESYGQVRLGIRGGISLSNVSMVNYDGEKQSTASIPRFQIGLTLDIPLAADFYLQPAALYAGKGYKQDGGWIVSAE